MKKLLYLSLLFITSVPTARMFCSAESTATAAELFDDPLFDELARIAQESPDESDMDIINLVDAMASDKTEAAQASWFNRYCTPYLVALFVYYQRCKHAMHEYWASFFNTGRK